MQNQSTHAMKAFIFIAVVTLGVHAQQRCDLVSRDTTINGVPAKQCIDIDSLNNKTVIVPSNVTRIDNQGFALCTKSVVTGGDADIVFIVDQSGSMNLPDDPGLSNTDPSRPAAYVSPSGTDTIYYQNQNGCPTPISANHNGLITIQPRVGAAITMYRMVSNTGCQFPAGDPFKVRALAVSRAIDYIASVSSSSTVGYLPFSTQIQPPFAPPYPQLGAGPQRPLSLTATNITVLKSRAIIDPAGGYTNYDPPLDSAKLWLTTRAITPSLTNKRAIIFISDGAPSPSNFDGDRDGFAKVNGVFVHIDKNIPIYSMFLGAPGSDTTKLKRLSDSTRGAFYRLPPQQPDSIISSVTKILNKILSKYTPDTILVTNNSIPQTSRATLASQFVDQGGGSSFKIILDSTLALRPNSIDSITIISKFYDVAHPDSIAKYNKSDTTKFRLSTTGPASGTITGGFGFTSKCYARTSLQWLNSAGVDPTNPPYFTDADTTVRVQVITSPNGQATLRPTLTAIVRPLPIDTLRLPLTRSPTDSTRFLRNIKIGYALPPILTPADTVLQTKVSDSLIAVWKNPRDPQDSARDTILIRPANKVASAYFSTHANGDTIVDTFSVNLTQAYLIVKDERPDVAHFPYQITIGTTVDQMTFTLTYDTAAKIFSNLINFSNTNSIPNDAVLGFNPLGDQVSGVYTDPVYQDQATAAAGIGQKVHFQSRVQFTDSLGNPLPIGTVWSLAHGKVYLKATAYNKANITGIPTQLIARSLKLGQLIGRDSELVSLTPRVPVTNGIATWSGNLNQVENITPSTNGTLQGAYRIEVTAKAEVHDSNGVVLPGQFDSATVIIAWPDGPASLGFSDVIDATDSAGPSAVIDTLKDQDFVHNSGSETVTATAMCPSGSVPGDTVTGWTFTQTGVAGTVGTYVSERLVRNNASVPTAGDKILSCPADSGVVVSYTDPVYGGTALQQAIPQVLTPIANPRSTPFTLDNLPITLQSGTSGTLINYTLNGALPLPGTPLPPSQLYDGNQVVIDQTTTLRAIGYKPGYLRSRVIYETYLKQPAVRSAYIKDMNGDGKADSVTLVFARPVITFPARIDSIFWNQRIASNTYVRASTAPRLSADSLTLTAIPDSPFPQFFTGIPSGLADSLKPIAKFPLGNYFNGLQALLADSVGPVIQSAIRLPSDLKTYTTLGGQTLVDPDTLIVTFSEPLAQANSWQNLLRFKSGAACGVLDLTSIQSSGKVFSLGATPTNTADTVFKVIVDNTPGRASPQPGDCVYLDTNVNPDNGSKKFDDFSGNVPGVVGVNLSGGQSQKAIRGMDGFPPVAGLAPGTKAFNLANSNLASDPNNPIRSAADLQWVPPLDFPSSCITDSAHCYYTPTSDTIGATENSTSPTKTLLPQHISTLQVVTSNKYIAHIHVSDHMGHFVKSWNQQFGHRGEFNNYNRVANGGKLSYLVWDERDSKKQLVSSGVYIWTVNFETQDSTGTVKKEIHVTRTGLVR